MLTIYVSDVDDPKKSLNSLSVSLMEDLLNILTQNSPYSGQLTHQLERTEEFNKICQAFKMPQFEVNPPSDLIELIEAYISERIARNLALQGPEFQAKREKQAVRRAELAQRSLEEKLAAWQAGGAALSHKERGGHALIKIKNNEVQTSHGANVPLVEARQLFRNIKAGTAKDGDRVGSYTFNRVDGDLITIGCHRFSLKAAAIVLSTGTHLTLVKRSV